MAVRVRREVAPRDGERKPAGVLRQAAGWFARGGPGPPAGQAAARARSPAVRRQAAIRRQAAVGAMQAVRPAEVRPALVRLAEVHRLKAVLAPGPGAVRMAVPLAAVLLAVLGHPPFPSAAVGRLRVRPAARPARGGDLLGPRHGAISWPKPGSPIRREGSPAGVGAVARSAWFGSSCCPAIAGATG